MSSFTPHELTVRGPDSVIELYLNSLYILKEKVATLLQNYHLTILQKMDCELGNIVTCNTDSFQSQLADVFTQLNEVEVQLNGLEAWSGLPPECFASAPSISQGLIPDVDQASHEAQALVELVHRLQATLRSMISQSGTNSTNPSKHLAGQSKDTPSQPKHVSTEPIVCSTLTFGPNSNAPNETEQIRRDELPATSREYTSQPPLDEFSLTTYTSRYAYNSPGSIPVGFRSSQSPVTGDKRYPDATDVNRGLFRSNQPGSLPYSSVSGAYNQIAPTSSSSPGVPGCYLSTDSRTQQHMIPGSKSVTSIYTDSNAGPTSKTIYSGLSLQPTNPEPFVGPYN